MAFCFAIRRNPRFSVLPLVSLKNFPIGFILPISPFSSRGFGEFFCFPPYKSGCQKQALNTQISHYTIKIVAMENKARYNVLDDKIVIIVTLPDKVRDRSLRCLRFFGRYSATADL